MKKNMHASRSVSRMWFSLVVIISALSCAVWAAVCDSTPRVLMPQLAGIVACSGAKPSYAEIFPDTGCFVFVSALNQALYRLCIEAC